MKKTVLLLTLCCVLIGCKKSEVSFSYSPEEPRAGQTVKFSNLSSSGEDWEWSFGDGSTSTLKSPSHVYNKPGKYLVSLKVDKKKSKMDSKQITVYDTVPTFVCEDSVFYIYEDYTFEANLYNPFNYTVESTWYLPVMSALLTPYVEITDETFDRSTLHLYFTRPEAEAWIGLQVVMNGDTTQILRSFNVQDRATNSVCFRTEEEVDFRQRIFGDKAADPQLLSEPSPLLDAEQDTLQTYNGKNFSLSELQTVFPEMEGFHIAKRKIYFRANGLWVANIDGANIVQIDTAACAAMNLDALDNRIYWANAQGVWYMPFIGSDNNHFVTEPSLLNALSTVTKIAVDNELK